VPSEGGEVLPEPREAIAPHREALHEDRAVIQPHRAVRSLVQEDRSAFALDISLFAEVLVGIRQGSSERKDRRPMRKMTRRSGRVHAPSLQRFLLEDLPPFTKEGAFVVDATAELVAEHLAARRLAAGTKGVRS
jgi:anti-sigma factor ChrR (cupin superfamily)